MIDIKTIGSSGQISLGKQYAGRTVTVEEVENGVWVVKTARVIPESELWLHTPPAQEELAKGLAWAKSRPPRESNLAAFERRLKKHR